METTEEYRRRTAGAEASAAVAINPQSKSNWLARAASWRRMSELAASVGCFPTGIYVLRVVVQDKPRNGSTVPVHVIQIDNVGKRGSEAWKEAMEEVSAVLQEIGRQHRRLNIQFIDKSGNPTGL